MGFKKLAVVMGIGMVMVAGSAMAKDQGHGDVKFHGSIIDAPCSIAPTGTDDGAIDVDLGQIATHVLKDGGASTPTDFSIHLIDCDTTTLNSVQVAFMGTSDTNDDSLLALGTGTASGAGVAIAHNGVQIKLGEKSPAEVIQGTEATLGFSAYLKGDNASAIVPGAFAATSTFQLTYQ